MTLRSVSAGLLAVAFAVGAVLAWRGGSRRPGLDAAEYITESVRSPTAFISPEWRPNGGPTEGMPALVVSDGELDAIIEYLLDRDETE